ARAGARDVRGPILAAYLHSDGPRSRLGWPATSMMSAYHDGHKVRFQHGRIYSHRSVGAHAVYGPIMTAWGKRGAASSWLGYPSANVVAVKGGLRGRFQHGVIRWHRRTDTYRIRHT
ncbi:MAG: hypothetical protein H0V07_04950, partial [Propionibacteriales bacterium]|nr:hypothetical protein [Propionibacteriales bacterium]